MNYLNLIGEHSGLAKFGGKDEDGNDIVCAVNMHNLSMLGFATRAYKTNDLRPEENNSALGESHRFGVYVGGRKGTLFLSMKRNAVDRSSPNSWVCAWYAIEATSETVADELLGDLIPQEKPDFDDEVPF